MRRGDAEDSVWLAMCADIASWSPDRFAAALQSVSGRPDAQRRLLRARFRYRVDEFLKFVFPDTFYGKWNRYARRLFADRPVHWRDRRTRRVRRRSAHAVGRGIGKSTLARGMLAHRLCYGLEAVVMVLSVKGDDAKVWTNTIRTWFSEPNERLTALYGETRVEGGVEWFNVVVGDAKCHIRPAGYGSAIRGYNYESIRPSLVILDDAEDRIRVQNADQRRIWQDWVNADVLKVGAKEGGTEFWWRGTILHPDAILARIINRVPPNDGWETELFKALLSEPSRSDLWERCAAIYHNKASFPDPTVRTKAARLFYERNRAAMDEGAEVLDPDLLPLFDLMVIRWSEGEGSFRRELQNDPRDPTTCIFDTRTFKRCTVYRDDGRTLIKTFDGRTVDVADCRRMVYWDPSGGGQSALADFAAIFVGAMDKFGYVYVIDGAMLKRSLTQQIKAVWEYAERWRVNRIVHENNATLGALQKFMDDERDARRSVPGRWHEVALVPHTSSDDKQERIASLEVPITAGYLQFADAGLPEELWRQFDEFTGTEGRRSQHDDGPDAVHGLYRNIAFGGVPQMVTTRS